MDLKNTTNIEIDASWEIFFWRFLVGKDRCELRLHPKHIIETSELAYESEDPEESSEKPAMRDAG